MTRRRSTRRTPTWSRQLSRRLSVRPCPGGFELTDFPTGREDHEFLVQPGLRYQLSPGVALFADYRIAGRTPTTRTPNTRENRVAVGVRLASDAGPERRAAPLVRLRPGSVRRR